MAARKSAHSSARYTWTTDQARDFVKHLEDVKRPDQPVEGRDEFLKLHPVCNACKNESCSLIPSDDFGVRCFQCRRKHISCPRQRDFWILCVAQRMSKPMALITEMYNTYGNTVQARYNETLSPKKDLVIHLDSDQEVNQRGSLRSSASSKSSLHGPENRGGKRVNEKTFVDLTTESRNTRSIDSDIDKFSELYPLVAKLAICRDQLRLVSRSFAVDAKAKRLTALLDQLDSIGEKFSEVLRDVEE